MCYHIIIITVVVVVAVVTEESDLWRENYNIVYVGYNNII